MTTRSNMRVLVPVAAFYAATLFTATIAQAGELPLHRNTLATHTALSAQTAGTAKVLDLAEAARDDAPTGAVSMARDDTPATLAPGPRKSWLKRMMEAMADRNSDRDSATHGPRAQKFYR